jgi:hypothetical protein
LSVGHKSAERRDPEIAEEQQRRGTSSDGYFFVGAEDLAEAFADFAQGGVGLYGGVDGGH